MTDVFTPADRSRVMSRIRGKDTAPELRVRKLVFAMGYRYRLGGAKLPGRPDLVLPRHKKVVFVHGCFWHGHPGCPKAARPTSNVAFWDAKLSANADRDARQLRELAELGWTPLVVWQCELRDEAALREKLAAFLTPASAPATSCAAS